MCERRVCEKRVCEGRVCEVLKSEDVECFRCLSLSS